MRADTPPPELRARHDGRDDEEQNGENRDRPAHRPDCPILTFRWIHDFLEPSMSSNGTGVRVGSAVNGRRPMPFTRGLLGITILLGLRLPLPTN
jgi:hypothetical protein